MCFFGCLIMRIATWNVERLKHFRQIDAILAACESARADILVLTETDERLCPDYRFCYQTPRMAEVQPSDYKATENRVSIYTNYPCIQQYLTFDRYTSLCVELATERGNLIVYGTIIGVLGNRNVSFKQDLLKQVSDFERLSANGKDLCVCGDYNCTFADNYYFTQFGRSTILQSFAKNHVRLLSRERPECIDHVAVSENFVGDADVHIEEWNQGKELSDHKGIVVDII